MLWKAIGFNYCTCRGRRVECDNDNNTDKYSNVSPHMIAISRKSVSSYVLLRDAIAGCNLVEGPLFRTSVRKHTNNYADDVCKGSFYGRK